MTKRIIYLAFICCVILFGCKPKTGLPDLRESYSYKDTKPFGAYIAKNIFEKSFPDNYVQTVKDPFVKATEVRDDTSSVYFSVSRNLYLTDTDVSSLLEFVYNGNTAFFAAANFDSALLNKIFCKVAIPDSSNIYIPPLYQETAVRLVKDISTSKDSFSYYYQPFQRYFSEINNRYGRIIGYNAGDSANCIIFFWGKGKLFLHAEPRAFSNYFLLKDDNYRYMAELMQLMHAVPQHVYWDDYYNKLNYRRNPDGGNSTLSEIFKYPPLKAAFWLALLLLSLYILFDRKRRQRIIKEIKPNQNSSVAFTETIARLYLQKHDNKNIADKMVTYFYEFIRNNYFLNANMGNNEFIKALSRKSGISEEKTISLFGAIEHVNKNDTIDDYQLLSLNEQIQQFYKKRK